MKRVMITGGTGMIGGLVLQQCLRSDGVREVISIVRRSSGIRHPKLHEAVHSDFTDFSSIANLGLSLCTLCALW